MEEHDGAIELSASLENLEERYNAYPEFMKMNRMKIDEMEKEKSAVGFLKRCKLHFEIKEYQLAMEDIGLIEGYVSENCDDEVDDSFRQEVTLLKGKCHFKMFNFDETIRIFRSLLEENSQYRILALLYTGKSYIYKRMTDKGKDFFDTLLREYPDNFLSHYHFGKFCRSVNNYSDSKLCFKKSYEMASTAREKMRSLCKLGLSVLSHMKKTREKECKESARRYLEKASKLDKFCYKTICHKIWLLRSQKSYVEGRRLMNIALKIRPKYYRLQCHEGWFHKDLEEYEKSIEKFLLAVKLKPTYYIGYRNAGVIYRIQRKNEKALEYFRLALEINPRYDVVMCDIARLLWYKGEYEEADEYFDRAFQAHKSTKHLLDKVYNLVSRRRYIEALECCRKCREIDPDDGEAICRMGEIYGKMGDKQKAEMKYKEYLSFEDLTLSMRLRGYISLGDMFIDNSKFDEALKYFLEFEQILKNHQEREREEEEKEDDDWKEDVSSFYISLGRLYYHDIHDLGEAFRCFLASDELLSTGISCYYIGDVFRSLEIPERSVFYYEKALKIARPLLHRAISTSLDSARKMMKEKQKDTRKFYTCKLSKKLFEDPVVLCQSGQVYERKNILQYLEDNGNVEPDGTKLSTTRLFTNDYLRVEVCMWKRKVVEKVLEKQDLKERYCYLVEKYPKSMLEVAITTKSSGEQIPLDLLKLACFFTL